jgi:hypothetical protein
MLFSKLVTWDDAGKFRCSGCDEFRLYRFICAHTLAVAEYHSLLVAHLAAVIDQFENETAELILKRQFQPGIGKKPSRRTGNPKTAHLQDRTVTEVRRRPAASQRAISSHDPVDSDENFPPTLPSVPSGTQPQQAPSASLFQSLGIRMPTTAEIVSISALKPLNLTE